MRDKLQALMDASDITSLAVSIIEDNTLTHIDTFGELEPDTIWSVASLTKPIFAYAVMLLVQDGIIDLDRPLQEYLSDTYTDDNHVPKMTAHHALSHTTGFPNWRDENGLRSAFQSGTKFSYSSEGLTYLQHVIEHVIAIPLHQYLRNNVFQPLGMGNTQLAPEDPNDLPPWLGFLKGSLLANSALSLRTTIQDYTKFMIAMLSDDKLSPLKQNYKSQMLHPQVSVSNVQNLHWGLGWGLQEVSDVQSFWHWGARGTPRTMNFAIGIPKENKAIIIFTNHADGLYLCQQIIDLWIGEPTLPAFDWLLPATNWRPDGKKPQ